MNRAAVVSALRAAGCVFAEEEADLLVAAATSGERSALVARRAAGEPLEHLLGWVEFRGRRVAVGPGVFVPRRRTELLVTAALAVLAQRSADERPAVVVELCCGCAAVSVALAAEALSRLGASIELRAADIDPVAATAAHTNLEPVGGTVHTGDLYDALPRDLLGRVDLLIANAPYVPSGAIATMPPEARDHEPRRALDGGTDGLDLHRRIAAAAPEWLSPGGAVLIETSRVQADGTIAAFVAAGLSASSVTDDRLDATAVLAGLPD